MASASPTRDTSPEAQAILLDRFAAMTIAERAITMEQLNDACTTLAVAGITAQHGELTADDLRWHLACRRYGAATADRVYGPR